MKILKVYGAVELEINPIVEYNYRKESLKKIFSNWRFFIQLI